jgi:transcriptional regulator with XRE-family HTH domain
MWHKLHTKDSFAFYTLAMVKRKILVAFGERVRELRKEKGFSQEELSFRADLHRTYIGMIERAEKNITLTNIEKIANALEITVSEIMVIQNGK